MSCIVVAYIKLSSGNLGIKPWLLWYHKVSLMSVCIAFQLKPSCIVFPLSGLWKIFLGYWKSFRLRKTDCDRFEKRHNWKCIPDQITREDNLLRGPLEYKQNLENMIYSWMSAVLFSPLHITTDWLLRSKYLFVLSITLCLSHSLMGIILCLWLQKHLWRKFECHQQRIETLLKASGRRKMFAQGAY